MDAKSVAAGLSLALYVLPRMKAGDPVPKVAQSIGGLSKARLMDIEAAVWEKEYRADLSRAGEQIAQVWANAAARPIHMDASPAEIRALAERRAMLMMDRLAVTAHMGLEALHEWINGEVKRLQGRPLRLKPGAKPEEQRKGLINRATCKNWWTKSLKKAAANLREAAGREMALVQSRREQYLTTETFRRILNQDAANLAMMENTEIESEDGERITLALAASKGTSNPLIRRGELMTRIKGCEEWADHHGLVGLFTTQTTPSRFHAVHRESGKLNERWIEAGKPTPKNGQQWLCKAWGRARAALNRGGIGVFGFRVAEPHHDGTPHWHGLFWVKPEHVEAVEKIIRHHWLNDPVEIHGPFKTGASDWQGAEVIASHWQPGRAEHGLKVMRMEKGGASGYIAKYIAKGIDDAGEVGATGHDDELDGRVVRMEQGDMFGGGAARVRAWARTHGIRQFQAIGQPPVTVWRELRRVPEAALVEASPRVRSAHEAVQRVGEKKADWAKYMLYQGGPFVGREYRIGLDTEAREVVGRYEIAQKDVPVGVVDRLEGKKAASDRKEWRPRGAWGLKTKPKASPPWTRVNNCTARNHENVAGMPVWLMKKEAGRLLTWGEVIRMDAQRE